MTHNTPSDSQMRSILERLDLRTLEAVAIGSTVVAFALTVFLVTTGRAVEANPVAAELLGTLGWTVAGGLAVGSLAAMFELLRHVERQKVVGKWLTRGAGVTIAAIGIGDVAYNTYLLTLVDVELGMFYFEKYGMSILAVTIASGLVFLRWAMIDSYIESSKGVER